MLLHSLMVMTQGRQLVFFVTVLLVIILGMKRAARANKASR